MRTIKDIQRDTIDWIDDQHISPMLKLLLESQLSIFVYLYQSLKDKQ